MIEPRQVERLKWRSRRGLLELDLVLTRFWANAGRNLTDAEAKVLEQLLALPDNDLLDMVMEKTQAPASLGAMVDKLKAA